MKLNKYVKMMNILKFQIFNLKKAPESVKGLSDSKKAPVWHPKYEIAPNECEIITKLLKGANLAKTMKV